MRIRGWATLTALISNLLAWAAFLWLAFWPYSYRGTSANATSTGSAAVQSTGTHASLVAVNGSWVIAPLLVPVIITAAILFITLIKQSSRTARISGLLAALLLIFSLLGLFSIGLFYVPAAIAALISGLILARHPATETRGGESG